MWVLGNGFLAQFCVYFNRLIYLLLILGSVSVTSRLMAQPLTLGTGEFPPYISESLPHQGPLSQIVSRAFQQAGYDTKIEFIPWNRAFKLAETGRIDGTYAWSIKADRQVTFLYSRPLFIFEQKAFAMANRAIDVSLNAPKKSVNLCRPQAYATQGWSNTLINEGIAVHFSPPDVETCFSMLKRGRVDIVVVDKLEGSNYVKRLFSAPDDVVTLDRTFYKYSNHLLIAKDHPQGEALIAAFDQGLDALMDSGEYQTILSNELGL